jgi:anti-sigma factor RsiW
MFGHVFNQLASYVESQVEESERARIERHLASCEQCRAALQRIRAGVALAATLTPERMPHDVVTRIRAATQSGDGRTHRRLPVTALWRAAAVLAAGLVTIGLYWHLNRPWIALDAAANAPTRFEREGRSLHEQIKSGTVAMSYTAEDEADLWQWLAREGAPVTSMQVTRTPSERAQFVPLGASVRTLGGAQSSVLAYRIDGRFEAALQRLSSRARLDRQ